jgi:hypothetical protein
MFMKYSGSGKLGHMSSLVPERLRRLALDALEEADLGPVRRSCAPRLALAYLASLHPRIWSSGEPYRRLLASALVRRAGASGRGRWNRRLASFIPGPR